MLFFKTYQIRRATFWECELFLCAIVMASTGCGNTTNVSGIPNVTSVESANTSYYPVTVQTFDTEGKSVEMTFSKIPKRVVADRVNTLAVLLALGQGDKVIATSAGESPLSYARLKEKYPEEIKKVQGNYGFDLDLETVVSLQPDFIMGWKSSFAKNRFRSTEWWNSQGVNTYILGTSNHVIPQGKIEDECQFILDMGRIFHAEDKANGYVEEIHSEISRAQMYAKGKPPQLAMMLEVGGRNIFNYDDGWIIGDMIRQMGGVMPVKARKLSSEQLIEYDPDVIFVDYFMEGQKANIQKFFDAPEYNSLKAVKNHRIYLIPFDYMYAPGINTIDSIRIVRDGLYPDLAGT